MTKLAKCRFIQAPKSQQELSDWIDSALPESERHIGHMIMMMTWNLCADLLDPDPEIELTPSERGEWDGDECQLKFY